MFPLFTVTVPLLGVLDVTETLYPLVMIVSLARGSNVTLLSSSVEAVSAIAVTDDSFTSVTLTVILWFVVFVPSDAVTVAV